MRASTVHSEPQPYGPPPYRSVLTNPAGPLVAYIDALRGPDGITCPSCRRARSVGIKSCEFCDENHQHAS